MAISFFRMSASELIDFLLEAEDTITRTNRMILEGDLTVVEDALHTAEMVLGDVLSAEDLLPFGCGEVLCEKHCCGYYNEVNVVVLREDHKYQLAKIAFFCC